MKHEDKKLKKEKAIAFHEGLNERRYPKSKDKWVCKGKKPHQLVLSVPSYYHWEGSAESFYEEMQKHRDVLSSHTCSLGERNCPFSSHSYYLCVKEYICVRCYKTFHDEIDKPNPRIQSLVEKL